jgi:hypothetical protein
VKDIIDKTIPTEIIIVVYPFGVKITLHGSPRRIVYLSSINKVSLDQAFFFIGLV